MQLQLQGRAPEEPAGSHRRPIAYLIRQKFADHLNDNPSINAFYHCAIDLNAEIVSFFERIFRNGESISTQC